MVYYIVSAGSSVFNILMNQSSNVVYIVNAGSSVFYISVSGETGRTENDPWGETTICPTLSQLIKPVRRITYMQGLDGANKDTCIRANNECLVLNCPVAAI